MKVQPVKSPWAKAIIILVTVLAIVTWALVWSSTFDKADADVRRDPTVICPRVPVTFEGNRCFRSMEEDPRVNVIEPGDGAEWGNGAARKFNNEALSNSTTKQIASKIDTYMDSWNIAHHNATGEWVDAWWNKETFNRMECLWNFGSPGIPEVSALGMGFCSHLGDNPTVSKINNELTQIRVVCGGSALIGGIGGFFASGPGGALIGAGSGGVGACYGRYAEAFLDEQADDNRVMALRAERR